MTRTSIRASSPRAAGCRAPPAAYTSSSRTARPHGLGLQEGEVVIFARKDRTEDWLRYALVVILKAPPLEQQGLADSQYTVLPCSKCGDGLRRAALRQLAPLHLPANTPVLVSRERRGYGGEDGDTFIMPPRRESSTRGAILAATRAGRAKLEVVVDYSHDAVDAAWQVNLADVGLLPGSLRLPSCRPTRAPSQSS